MNADAVTHAPTGLAATVERVDGVLATFLHDIREEVAAVATEATLVVDEVSRIVTAGGKRLRPTFCYWGFRAAGGADGDPIVRAASALELLHTMALIHDDLMDRAVERRGVPSSAVYLAGEARLHGSRDPDQAGRSLAILAGDLAAVLADRLFLSSGFGPDVLVPALDRYHRMRTDMAAGQCLDILDDATTERTLVAALKGGTYTVAAPLAIGATLAGATSRALTTLEAFGDPLGVAFQLHDDELDGDAPVEPQQVAALAGRARKALEGAPLDPQAVEVLGSLVDRIVT